MAATVSLETLVKSYGTTPVVKGLSLHLPAGQFLSLLGPSGCGKTTTLRMVAGLERPDSGTIRIGDDVVDGPGAHVPPERRGLAMVFQSYAVWPHLTVAKNVAYPLERQGVPRAEHGARVTEALAQVHLSPFAERMPHALSGGQLQRVALARALAARPRVLLLDEPLSNLDAALREELRGELASLRARLGTTMLYVTHDQAEALALSDQVAVMNKGVLEQLAPPGELYEAPATPFVAGFVGGSNVLDGAVESGAFVTSGQRFSLPAGANAPDGPATLAVRPEDVQVGSGTSLALTARLFLGSTTEYRFALGDTVLRGTGAAIAGAGPGSALEVHFSKVRLFPRR
jgi:ABC-type Fe3+/spermidine/putrescine transport system ATPase subunit